MNASRAKTALALCTLGLQLGSSVASADPGGSWDDYYGDPMNQGYQPNQELPPQSRWEQAMPPERLFAGVDLGVPVVLDVDRDLIRPGVNLHGQGGIDLGYAAFFVHGGWRWIPVDFDRASKGHPQYDGEGREPLKNPYFGIGARLQVPNRTRLMPYVSGSVDFNFWNFNESETACAGGFYYWWCADYDVYRFTAGFSARGGLAVHVANGMYVDLGMGLSMSFQGDFFDRNEVWLEPFVGMAYRR
jgi:hypothetical protein